MKVTHSTKVRTSVACGSLIKEAERFGISGEFVKCLSAAREVESQVIDHGTS